MRSHPHAVFVTALLAALVATVGTPAYALDIRVDFAADHTGPSGSWNTVSVASSPGGDIANLVDYGTGSGTGISLSVTDAFGDMGMIAGNAWAAPPTFRSWIDPAATRDSFYTRMSDHPTGQITLSGLDDGQTYRVEVIGSRGDPTSRKGDFRVNSDYSDSRNSDGYDAYYDGHQDHTTMFWRSVTPSGGEIQLDIEPHASQHGYLSAMRITEAPPQTILIDVGHTDSQTLGQWNNIHSDDYNSTGGLGYRILAATDATGQQTAVNVKLVADFQGSNPLGESADAAGFARSAQADSFAIPAGSTGTFQIEGLTPGEQYEITLFGSRQGTGRTAAYTVGGTTQTLLNSGNTASSVTFTNVSPDPGGNVQIDTSVAGGSFGYLGVVEIKGEFSSEPLHQAVLLDLGHTSRQTTGNWNNMTSDDYNSTEGPGHYVLGAIDNRGLQTGLSFSLLDDFQGANPDGMDAIAAGFPSSAQSDSFAIGQGVTATLQVEGLVPGQQYDITLFGSRQTVGADNRTAAYTIGGTTQTLLNEGNTRNSVTFAGVAADARGRVQIDTAAADEFGYLGVVEIQGSFRPPPMAPKPSVLFDFGLDTRQTAGNWNNLPSSHTGSGGTGAADVIGAVDSLGHSTNVNLIIVDDFPGVNTTGEASNDAGFPTSAQSDSFYLGNGDDHAQLRIEGLDPTDWYDIILFGSRRASDASPVRAIDFEILGQTITLDNYGNTSDVVTFSGISPDLDGNIVIDLHRADGASFGYFGALQITPVFVPEPATVLVLSIGLIGLIRRSRRRSG